MTGLIHKRARKAEQKELRRKQILEAATFLLQEKEYSEIKLADVAKELKLCKGTLYLYFRTKEELFLALFQEKFSLLTQEWEFNLEGANNQEEVVQALVEPLGGKVVELRLMAVFNQILEHNISKKSALEFKQDTHERVARLTRLVEAKAGLESGGGMAFLMRFYSTLIGTWILSNPAPVIIEVMEENPELAVASLDFKQEITIMARLLLQG